MEIVSALLGITGFGFGIPVGLFLGFIVFILLVPQDVKEEEPEIKPVNLLDTNSVLDILPEIPMWMKHPDYERIDWLNKFITYMWPYLDKAICNSIGSTINSIFAEYSGKFFMQSLYLKSLTLGTLPPTIHGIKVHQINEKELLIDPAIRWAGNPDITLVMQFFSLPITVQLLDIQVFLSPRISLRPLVPTFPCFASIFVSLLEKPHIDFGLKFLGADVMAIPGFYQFVQELISREIARLYLWPRTLDIQILDGSIGATKKPVGILHVKVVSAKKLLKMDLLGTSDPYVQLSLSGAMLPAKTTSIKLNNLNPEWNENFKLIVKDPQSQVLQLHVYDWEKIGSHDKLGMQIVPLRLLIPYETTQFKLDLVKNTNPDDAHNKKYRGNLVVELTFKPFKEDNESIDTWINQSISLNTGGLLLVTVEEAEDVEGKHHNNPYALVIFRGEQKKTKLINKTRNPIWKEEFQFMLEDAPQEEKIHIEVKSKKRTLFGCHCTEILGYVDINLMDVVYNGRINEKYDLINAKNGVISVDVRWKAL